jgi:putative aminopeptidase FrvX
VVVTLGKGRDTIVVGAHYDAKWITDKSLSRGAVDNGASSVMLVHAAAALKNQRLKSRVTFVWFDFEESGCSARRSTPRRTRAIASRRCSTTTSTATAIR